MHIRILALKNSMNATKANLRYDAKLIKTSAVGCATHAASMLQNLSITRLEKIKLGEYKFINQTAK